MTLSPIHRKKEVEAMKKRKKKYREIPMEELSAQYKDIAKELWSEILPEIAEKDDEGTIAPIIEENLPYVIEATGMALEWLRPDPRAKMGTIAIKTYQGDTKKEQHGVKLRFKSLEVVEAVEMTEDGERRYKRGIWRFHGWSIYRTKEGWRFQFEIDLTTGTPRLIRNFAHQEILSVEIWRAKEVEA